MNRSFLIASFILAFCTIHKAASQDKQKLTLEMALQIAGENNLNIRNARVQQKISEEYYHEEKEKRTPNLGFHASYARITNLTEFNSGITDKVVTNTIPEWADATLSATLPIYSGNIINNSIKKAGQKNEIALLDIEKKTNDTHIEVIASFLGIYKLMKLEELLIENCKEAEDRLKEVRSFRKHGTVTHNEVLRNELQLSDRQLQLLSNKRNVSIAYHHLKTILQLPAHDPIEIDTLNLITSLPVTRDLKYYEEAAFKKEEVMIALQKEGIRNTDIAIVKGGYYPKISLFASYGINYPNYMFFPPNPNTYTLGKIGVEMVFDISGLYKNATRLAISRKNLESEKIETSLLMNVISNNVFEQYTRCREILDKIPVTEKDMAHAKENYRIVRLKYLNQLALMTDMVDADNALLQAQFNNISAKIDALMKYYELQHAAGLLQNNK